MKVALIGLGMVSGTFADAISNCEAVDLSLVYARSAESRAQFLKKWPDLGAVAATSIADIAASDVDFVLVTTPPNARQEIVEELAAAGKPILMEKPIERTLDAAV
jgi:predicted dehydrogenase